MSVQINGSQVRLKRLFAGLPTFEYPITVAGIAKVDSFVAGRYQTVFGLHDSGGQNYLLIQDGGDTSGVMQLEVRDFPAASVRIGGPTVSAGDWWFYAYTINSAGTTFKFHYAQVGVDTAITTQSDNYDPIYADSPDFCIGNSMWTGGDESLNGHVAGVKIWTTELTSDELLQEFFAGTKLVKFDNIWAYYVHSGFNTLDRSGNERNLSQDGSVTHEANPPGPEPFGYWGENEDLQEVDLSPTGLTLTEQAGPQVLISFTDQTGGLQQHRILRKTTGSWQPIATLPEGDTDWTDATVSTATTYTYRVCVFDVGMLTTYCASDNITVGTVPELEQEGYRFRNDDGSESGATWKVAQDTNLSLGVGDRFRLRFVVDAVGDPAAATFQLQARKQGEATWKNVSVEG